MHQPFVPSHSWFWYLWVAGVGGTVFEVLGCLVREFFLFWKDLRLVWYDFDNIQRSKHTMRIPFILLTSKHQF